MMRRRAFFGGVFAGLAGAAAARPQRPRSGGVPTRVLGKTGQKLSIVGMGGARFHLIPFDEDQLEVRFPGARACILQLPGFGEG